VFNIESIYIRDVSVGEVGNPKLKIRGKNQTGPWIEIVDGNTKVFEIPATGIISSNYVQGGGGGSGIDTTAFDAGQFSAVSGANGIGNQAGKTNATAGSDANFDFAVGAGTIFETTNSANMTITVINSASLTGRSKVRLLRVFQPGTFTLTLSGISTTARSGVFVSPPPAGWNEYQIHQIGSTYYLDVFGPIVSSVGISIDGGGNAITTGVKGYIEVPYSGIITAVTLIADQSGSAVIDIWKDTYANYPPLVGDSITASAKPTLSSAIKYTDVTLTGWTTNVVAGDIIGFNVDSATTVTRLNLSLKINR
jgi:hypothetical protein